MNFQSKFAFYYTAIALCLVTLISRAPFTELSPIIDIVANEMGLSKTQQGIILSLPTFVMAFFALLVVKIDQKIGFVLAILYGMFAIALGIVIRDYLSSYITPGVYSIYLGTIILSLGITIISVLYPAFINGFFRKQLGLLNAINGANLSVSSLLGTFSALLMIELGYSWQAVGSLWLIVTIAIIIVYLPSLKFTAGGMKVIRQSRENIDLSTSAPVKVSMWRQLAPWCIAITFGLESFNFYFAISWFKSYIGEAITNAQFSFLVNLFQLLALVFSLITPIVVMKYKEKLAVIFFISSAIFSATTISMLFVTNYYLLIVIFAIFGALAGFILAVLLLLLSLKLNTSAGTSKLSSIVNSVGFIVTSIYLLLFGWLYDITDTYYASIALLVVGSIILPITSYFAVKLKIIE
ncbi:hypothetical protein CKF54_01755 [Psittacicella hinzii]|uniref:Major facilitator superfamily (MFS) profile domain-containing protein n=1 Tax=Psittacicella hinzii TaxID=2028575 RepID=A0A3A1Y7H3_9GAMM|nr:MFS transporter [Psittacicella hinzii]RIY34182.1 hypothetical protein CKF54_01755 [Psittacicella hinzii]